MTDQEAHTGLVLTDDQQAALKLLQEFVANTEAQIFVLSGYAGTGKTTLIKMLADHCNNDKIPFTLLATTGRAAKVLATKTGYKAKTLHRYIYRIDVSEMDDFKGTVLKIKEVVPIPGMSPGVALEIQVSKSETFLVHLCPTWYADPKTIGIKAGEKVKVRGAWAEIDGKAIEVLPDHNGKPSQLRRTIRFTVLNTDRTVNTAALPE